MDFHYLDSCLPGIQQKVFQPEPKIQQKQKFRQKKFSSPPQQMLNKRKNIYPLHPAEQNVEDVVVDKFNRTLKNSLVYIKKSLLNIMIHHCQQEAPYEACGFLSGIREKNETLYKMRNIERTTTTFAMDVNQMSQVFK